MKSLLLIIDLQKAFINNNTKELPEKIKILIENNKYDKVAFTRFINDDDSIYVKKLGWKRCVSEEDKRIVIDTQNNKVFDKSTYSAVSKELIDYIIENEITTIYLCGIDTECCILKTAFDLFELEYNIYVLKDYSYCTLGTERNESALNILRRNIGKDYII